MSNEEKILALLATMNKRLDTMDGRLDTMEKAQAAQGEAISAMRDDIVELKLFNENTVLPNFALLAEGHKTLQETLAPKDRVEALEGDVDLLKELIRSMNRRLSDLEEAQ